MATRNEHPERYRWWLNELESTRINKLNNLKEMRKCVNEYVKHAIYHEYYNENVIYLI